MFVQDRGPVGRASALVLVVTSLIVTSLLVTGASSGVAVSAGAPAAPGYATANSPARAATGVATASTTPGAVHPSDSVFSVAFQEEGLPNGSTWFLAFNGSGWVADTITNGSGEIDFNATNGNYSYAVQPNMWYSITNRTGTVVVNGTDASIDIVFTALPTVPVTFRENGAPLGTSWGISLGYPAVVASTTLTYLVFNVPNVSVPFNLTPPPGFGVAKVVGPTVPSQTLVNVTGKSTVGVTFGPIETLYFNESGLPTGTFWAIALHSSLAHGGPPGQAGNSTGASISFQVVKGSWKFQLTAKPSIYLAHPGKGTVGVPSHTVTRNLKFTLIAENVVFHRTGLPSGTTWGVNVTGPMNLSLSGTTATLKARLCNGTYTWTAWNFVALHPHASNGSVTVVAPSATHVIVVAYTALPVVGVTLVVLAPTPSTYASVLSAAAVRMG
jgi:hypothetical protein